VKLYEWHALVTGLLLAAGGLSAWLGRFRLAVLVSVVLGGVVYGSQQGILLPSDLAALPGHAALERPLALWLAWALFATAAASSSKTAIGGRLGPVLLGAVFGELGGAVLAASGVDNPSHKARRVLAASAGALLSRTGDPAVLLHSGDGRLAFTLAVCGCVGVAVAAPPAASSGSLDRRSWAVGGVAFVAAFLPSLALPVLALGAVALLAIHQRRPDPTPLLHAVGIAVLVLVGVASGTTEHLASTLEAVTIPMEQHLPQVIALGGTGAGLLLGSGGGGLLGVAVLDRALAVTAPDAKALWTVMAAVAGLGPMLLTGTLQRGLWRHLLWVGLCLGVVHGMVLAGVLR